MPKSFVPSMLESALLARSYSPSDDIAAVSDSLPKTSLSLLLSLSAPASFSVSSFFSFAAALRRVSFLSSSAFESDRILLYSFGDDAVLTSSGASPL